MESGENVKSSNSLYSDSANAYLLTPNIGIRLDINSDYLKTRTSLSLSGNILSVSSLDRSALGGVNAIDRYANLNFSYLESLYFGKWLSDSFPNLFGKWWTRQQILTRFHFLQGLSGKRLLPQNQFVLGERNGTRIPGISCSWGQRVFLSVEYRLPIIYNSHFDVSLNPFLDWGQTYINDPLFYEFDQNLLGAGIGLSFNYQWDFLR